MAGTLGADAFVQFGDNEVGEAQEALGGAPDVVLECIGEVGMLGKAVEHIRSDGTIISLGFCTKPDPVIPGVATFKQVRMIFSMAYTLAEFEQVARALDAGHVEPRAMITETISLETLPSMIEQLRQGTNQTKVHVTAN